MPTKIFKKPRKSQFGIVKGTPSVNALAVRAVMLKANNLSLALKLVLENPGGTSRATISSQTGITRATSSRLVDELVEMNLLEELATVTQTENNTELARIGEVKETVGKSEGLPARFYESRKPGSYHRKSSRFPLLARHLSIA